MRGSLRLRWGGPVRPAFALMLGLAIGLAGCGDDNDPLNPAMGTGTGSSFPECAPCFDTLVTETDRCGPALDQCLDDPTLDLEPIVVCFETEGACFDDALHRSAVCNNACGDTSQAQVELCAGQCFIQRAECAERAVRGTDACLSVCGGAACEQCTLNGQDAFDQCNSKLEVCADRCVSTFRT